MDQSTDGPITIHKLFPKNMGVHVLHGLIYNICEVYIDDMLIFGTKEDKFLTKTHTVFQRCRERNVTLNAKKLIIGFYTIPFVGHDIDWEKGINMSQKRIESTIAFCKPTSLKELQSFMGVVNYFQDHLRDHSAVAKPLYDMVASAIKQKIKSLALTPDGHIAFEKLKALVSTCLCCSQ